MQSTILPYHVNNKIVYYKHLHPFVCVFLVARTGLCIVCENIKSFSFLLIVFKMHFFANAVHFINLRLCSAVTRSSKASTF